MARLTEVMFSSVEWWSLLLLFGGAAFLPPLLFLLVVLPSSSFGWGWSLLLWPVLQLKSVRPDIFALQRLKYVSPDVLDPAIVPLCGFPFLLPKASHFLVFSF